MRAWYVPSWSGDLRLEADPKDEGRTLLSIVDPTEGERRVLAAIRAACVREGWCDEKSRWSTRLGRRKVRLEAPIATVGPVVAKLMRPGEAVLTAVTFSGGKMITSTGSAVDLAEVVREGALEAKTAAANAEEKPKPEVAATVKRPTPSCPQCVRGAVGPASEVLLAFLRDAEHEDWRRYRAIVVEGGLSGHRYLLAHRATDRAAHQGRICLDLDDGVVVHFHDWTVPPEEEVLAAKLILEHREDWLRNEATLYHAPHLLRFKNPFGDVRDGVPDAQFSQAFGQVLGAALGVRL